MMGVSYADRAAFLTPTDVLRCYSMCSLPETWCEMEVGKTTRVRRYLERLGADADGNALHPIKFSRNISLASYCRYAHLQFVIVVLDPLVDVDIFEPASRILSRTLRPLSWNPSPCLQGA